MRLTLRTLLAWMDGVLPDDQRAALGEKVEASQLARQLVDRIEGAVANDRIDAPRVAGKGLVADANTVAEYLDNVLATERLEAFETICLESDLHLAEVAGCHRMLAEVARDPAVLAPLDAARRRALLESIEHRMQGQPDILLAGAAAPQGAADRSTARGEARGGGAALRPVAPEPKHAARRRTPAAVWALLGSSLLVMLALGTVFLRSAGLLGGGDAPRERVAERRDAPPAGAAAGPVAGEDGGVNAGAGDPAAAPAEADVAVAPAPATEQGADADDRGAPRRGLADLLAQADAADAAAAAEAGAAAPGAAPGDEPIDAATAPEAGPAVPRGPATVPAGEALAIAAGARPARPPRAAPAAPGAAPDVAAAVGLDALPAGKGIGFLAADGVALVRVAAGAIVTWHALTPEGQVGDGTEIVVPPGMRPEINLGGISVRCQPGSILRFALAADGTPRVEVMLGRVVCRAARDDGRISLRARDLDGVVGRGLEGGVAVEVAAVERPGEGDAGRTAFARIVAIREAIEWTAAGPGEGAATIPAGGSLGDPAAAAGGDAGVAEGPPDWITGTQPGETLERGAAAAFVRRLAELPEGSAPAAGLAQVLEAMAIDRRVENRVFAATTLALTGQYDVAADLLCAEVAGRRLEGKQWAALEAAVVPMALARGEASADRLRRAWEERGPPGRATLIDLMARRPTDAELESGADRAIVEALGDGALVVRRYALACLDTIVRPGPADRARYRPDASEDARRDGAAWWRTQQERGLVRRSR